MTALIELLCDLPLWLVLLAPAWLVHRLLRPQPTALEAVAEVGLLTVTLVALPAFTLALVARQFLTVGLVLLTSATIALLAGLALAHRHGWRLGDLAHGLAGFAPATGPSLPALIAAVLTLGVLLVSYDRRHFQYGCINGVVMMAITSDAAPAYDPHGGQDDLAEPTASVDFGTPESPHDPQQMHAGGSESELRMELLAHRGTGQRYGTTAIIAPMVACFGVLGFRLVFALLPALCVLFGARLATRLTGRPRISATAAALAVLNPYVLKIVILDENVMAFALGMAALALLVEHRTAARPLPVAVLAGWAFGAMLGVRHVDLPFLATAVVLLGWRPRSLGAFLGATAAAALPCALHHIVAYGTLFTEEHFVDEVFFATPHALFGWEFSYTGLLNWPFTLDHALVRTPYNPLPTLLFYPVQFIAHVGSLLAALTVIGAVQLFRRERRLTLALAVYALPLYGLLAVLENWMDPNKMGVLINLFVALPVVLALGLDWLLIRSWRPSALKAGVTAVVAAVVTAVVTAALSGLTVAAAHLTFPDDPRFYVKYPKVRRERPEYLAFERDNVSHGSPLPSLRFLEQYAPFVLGERLGFLWDELGDRRFRRPVAPIAEAPDGSVLVTLDLSRPLIHREDVVTYTPNAPDALDVTAAKVAVELTGLSSFVTDRATGVLVVRQATHELEVFLRFGADGFADVESERRFTIEQRARPEVVKVPRTGVGLVLRVRPGDRIRILETVSLDEVLVYVVEATVAADGTVTPRRARRMFHN